MYDYHGQWYTLLHLGQSATYCVYYLSKTYVESENTLC